MLCWSSRDMELKMQHEVILCLSNGGNKKPISLGISVRNYQDSGIKTGTFPWISVSNTKPVEKWRYIFLCVWMKTKIFTFNGKFTNDLNRTLSMHSRGESHIPNCGCSQYSQWNMSQLCEAAEAETGDWVNTINGCIVLGWYKLPQNICIWWIEHGPNPLKNLQMTDYPWCMLPHYKHKRRWP